MKIPRRSPKCHICGASLKEKGVYFSTLEEELIVRTDTCPDCFVKSDKLWWRGEIEREPPPGREAIDETAFALLDEGETTPFSNFLANFLQRRRQLIRRAKRGDELVFEDRISGHSYIVPDCVLSESELNQFVEMLSERGS